MQYNFPKMRGEGSKAVWNFSENSSDLVAWPFDSVPIIFWDELLHGKSRFGTGLSSHPMPIYLDLCLHRYTGCLKMSFAELCNLVSHNRFNEGGKYKSRASSIGKDLFQIDFLWNSQSKRNNSKQYELKGGCTKTLDLGHQPHMSPVQKRLSSNTLKKHIRIIPVLPKHALHLVWVLD